MAGGFYSPGAGCPGAACVFFWLGGWDFPFRALSVRGVAARLACASPQTSGGGAQGSPVGIATPSQPERWGDAQAAMSRSSRDVQDVPLPVAFLHRQLIDPRPRVCD